MGSAKPRAKPGTNRASVGAPPTDLVAYRIDAPDDELVVFEWNPTSAAGSPETEATLSVAERGVLDLVLAGKSNAEIATLRSVSARTVANQVASLLRKLGVGSRFELIGRLPTASRPR